MFYLIFIFRYYIKTSITGQNKRFKNKICISRLRLICRIFFSFFFFYGNCRSKNHKQIKLNNYNRFCSTICNDKTKQKLQFTNRWWNLVCFFVVVVVVSAWFSFFLYDFFPFLWFFFAGKINNFFYNLNFFTLANLVEKKIILFPEYWLTCIYSDANAI